MESNRKFIVQIDNFFMCPNQMNQVSIYRILKMIKFDVIKNFRK